MGYALVGQLLFGHQVMNLGGGFSLSTPLALSLSLPLTRSQFISLTLYPSPFSLSSTLAITFGFWG